MKRIFLGGMVFLTLLIGIAVVGELVLIKVNPDHPLVACELLDYDTCHKVGHCVYPRDYDIKNPDRCMSSWEWLHQGDLD